MVVVGITDEIQIYPTLPDYEYKLSIVIDTFIVDDDEGKIAESIFKEIKTTIKAQGNKNVSDIFDELPVVGFIYEGSSHTITAESNRYELNYSVYVSKTE